MGRRILYSLLAPVAGALAGALVMGPLLMLGIGKVGNRWPLDALMIGAGCGAMFGIILGAQLLPPFLLRRLFGVDYRQYD